MSHTGSLHPLCLALALIAGTTLAQGHSINPGDGMFPAQVDPELGNDNGLIDYHDFNGDGLADKLISLSTYSNSIAIRLPDGSFAPKIEIDQSLAISTDLLADYNSDGLTDLASFATTDDGVFLQIHLGNGDGTFLDPAEGVFVEPPFSDFALGDIDDNSFLDIVVAKSESTQILLGQGDGRFVESTPQSIAGNLGDLHLSHIDADGALDLVYKASSSIAIAFGNGDSTFTKPMAVPLGMSISDLEVADLDGDGADDLLATHQQESLLSVLLSTGKRTFETTVTYSTDFAPFEVAVGDINGDGIADVGVTTFSESIQEARLYLLGGNGDGTLAPRPSTLLAFLEISIEFNDVDLDGDLDVFFPGYILPNYLLNNGDGQFATLIKFDQNELDSRTATDVALCDLNDDGQPDMIESYWRSPPLYPAVVRVHLGQSEGLFDAPQDYPIPPFHDGDLSASIDSLTTGDINGDGHLDIIGAHRTSDTIALLLGDGSGAFQSPIAYTFNPTSVGDDRRVSTAFLNDDEHLDVVFSDEESVTVLLGTGDETLFTHSRILHDWNLAGHAIADLNHDGSADIAITTERTGIQILFGIPDGTFVAGPTIEGNPRDVAVGHIDDDGFIDLVTADDGKTMNVYLGNGDGTFDLAQLVPTASFGRTIELKDMDNSGTLDLVISHILTTIGIALGNGDGSFSAVNHFMTGRNNVRLAIGDINGDGGNDIAFTRPRKLWHTFDRYPRARVMLNQIDFDTCLADFTGDTILDFFDVSAFLDAFAAEDPSADLTDDQNWDFFDVSAFLDAFGEGCP